MQMLCCLNDAAVFGNRPEIQQMLVIHFDFPEVFTKLNLIYAKYSSP